jgi:hypothetical protein
MNDMAARGDMQQQYPAMGGGAARTAWPEPEPGLRPAVPPAVGAESRSAARPVQTPPPGECAAAEQVAAEYASPEELELALFGQLIDPTNDEVRLSAGPGSSARARRLTMSALESWGLGGHGDVAVQLVAELIANAVRHTGGRTFGLRLVRRHGCVRFEVRDPSRALPCLIMGEVDDEGGRGLQLVNTLAQRWGADLLSHGKSVWFELRVRETA